MAVSKSTADLVKKSLEEEVKKSEPVETIKPDSNLDKVMESEFVPSIVKEPTALSFPAAARIVARMMGDLSEGSDPTPGQMMELTAEIYDVVREHASNVPGDEFDAAMNKNRAKAMEFLMVYAGAVGESLSFDN